MRQLGRPPRRFATMATAIPVGTTWGGNNASKAFRASMTRWCIWNQSGRCFYCGILVLPNTRVTRALDHIVPKGQRTGRPEWAHLPINLVMACWHCNSNLKGQVSPLIPGKKSPYRSRNYDFVHPYLDDPERHVLGGFDERAGLPSPVKYTSAKGKRTVELFRLNDPRMLRLWQSERYIQELDLIEDSLPPGRVQQRDAIISELRRSMSPGAPTTARVTS